MNEESKERVELQDYQFHRLKAIEKQKEEGRVLKIGLMEQGVNSSSTSSLESMVRGQGRTLYVRGPNKVLFRYQDHRERQKISEALGAHASTESQPSIPDLATQEAQQQAADLTQANEYADMRAALQRAHEHR